MKRYKPLLTEWQPEKFQYAREIGLLDKNKKIQKEIPEYLIRFLSLFPKIKIEELNNKNFFKNKINSHNDRIIIWENNYYSTSNKYLHQFIIAYLILHEGLILENSSEIRNWYYKTNIFLGLQLKEKDLLISETYKVFDRTMIKKNIVDNIRKNINHYKDIIKKIEKQTKTIFEYDYNVDN